MDLKYGPMVVMGSIVSRVMVTAAQGTPGKLFWGSLAGQFGVIFPGGWELPKLIPVAWAIGIKWSWLQTEADKNIPATMDRKPIATG